MRAAACGPDYNDPDDYFMYRVSDLYKTGRYETIHYNYGDSDNCLLWQEQTSSLIPVEDIYEMVYKADIHLIEAICLHRVASDVTPGFEDNKFAAWLREDHEAAEFLLLAKQCEAVRSEMVSPWYYPSRKDPSKMTLETIAANAREYSGRRFAGRYFLQAERAMFSLRRFDECINYWNEKGVSLPDNIVRRMAMRYVAGAYFNIGDKEAAMRMFGEADDIGSLLTCAGKSGIGKLADIYEYAPGSQSLREDVERIVIRAETKLMVYGGRSAPGSCKTVLSQDSREDLEYVYRLSLRIAREGKVEDPDFWYYSAAFIQYLLGNNADALRTVRTARASGGSKYIKESAHVLQLYLESLGPYNASYETRMLEGVEWLARKVKEHLDEGREDTIIRGVYLTGINFSYYYWNDMLRKIVHSGIVPRLVKSDRGETALAFSNMADNLIFNLVGEVDDGCWDSPRRVSLENYRKEGTFNGIDYSNQTFSLLDTLDIETLIQYAASLDNPSNAMQMYLNSNGYVNRDYFNEIIGTRLIRDMRYSEAEKWLAKVPFSFQRQLNTFRKGCFKFDPFRYECARIESQTDCKYNFAREMASLEKAVAQTNDSDRKALLMVRLATGMKNSFGNCWALSFYRLSWLDKSGYPATFLATQERGFERAETLFRKALAICRDDETAALINMYLGNAKTVVSDYGDTRAAEYVRGHCDTYFDYHFEQRKHFWNYRD